MTYREKLTWGRLVLWIVFTCSATVVAGRALLAGQPLREAGLTDAFILFGAIALVVAWLAGRGVRPSERQKPDERERLVELKAGGFGRGALLVALLVIGFGLPGDLLAGLPPRDLKLAILYLLMLVFAVGEIGDLAARAFLYRAMR